mmetsp:Transcript_31399/g.38968  ORF Transcript_31399/g.38968 Transcript_31399/m.38968 type:complete len:90 (+) Transcript_31399:1379-1648(+)
MLVYEKPRQNLHEVSIRGNPIGIEGVRLFVTGFTSQAKGANLSNLDISRTNCFYHTASFFCEQLAQMLSAGSLLSRLRKLDLSENLVGD